MDDTFTSAPSQVVAGLDDKHHVPLHPTGGESSPATYENGHVIPTEEEMSTLPRIAGKMPWTAYLLCGVEFAERASYYGCKQVFKNFIRGPLPVSLLGISWGDSSLTQNRKTATVLELLLVAPRQTQVLVLLERAPSLHQR